MTIPNSAVRPKGRYTQPLRLITLYDRLHRRDRLHPGSVAAQLGVSRRTIERDLGVLADVLGDRLVRDVAYGDHVVYYLDGGDVRWKTSRWQALAVAVGARMTGFLRGRRFMTEVQPLLAQLGDSLSRGQRRDVSALAGKVHVIETGQKRYRTNDVLQDWLEVMLDAVLCERPVELSYLSPSRAARGEPARDLRVHPLCLVLHRGGVYFVVDVPDGLAVASPSRILLSLDRIQRAALADDQTTFEPPKDFDAESHFASAFAIWGGPDLHHVRLRIDARFAVFVRERRWHHSQTVVSDAQGRLLIDLYVGQLKEVEEWVLSMGEFVDVLGPPALRDAVAGRLRAALARVEVAPPNLDAT